MITIVTLLTLGAAILYLQIGKEVEGMAVVYATLIIKGLKTIDDVPSRLREQVQEILDALEI